MVQSLSRELAPMGIRVNAVAPGVTKTDMVANLPEEVIKPIIATIPLGRMGEPEDVANAFVFPGERHVLLRHGRRAPRRRSRPLLRSHKLWLQAST